MITPGPDRAGGIMWEAAAWVWRRFGDVQTIQWLWMGASGLLTAGMVVWSILSRLPGPLVFALGLATFVIVLMGANEIALRQHRRQRRASPSTKEARPTVEPLNLAVNMPGKALVVRFRFQSQMFLAFTNVEVVSRMIRECAVALSLRLRMRDGQWVSLPATELPRFGELPQDISAARPLPLPVRLLSKETAGGGIMTGHVAFFLEEWAETRFGINLTFDVLRPENINFEARDIGTGETLLLPVNRRASQWIGIALDG